MMTTNDGFGTYIHMQFAKLSKHFKTSTIFQGTYMWIKETASRILLKMQVSTEYFDLRTHTNTHTQIFDEFY